MVCPIVVPCYREGGPTCYVNLLEYKAYTYAAGKATEVPIPDMGHRLDGLRTGTNHLVIEVRNNPGHRERDAFSAFLAMPPSGVLGPVQWIE